MALIPISPAEASEEDLRNLLKACAPGYTGVTAGHVLKEAYRGKLQLYRTQGGIIVLQVIQHESGVRELLVYALGGKGIFARRKEIFRELEALARANQCRFIGGRSIIPEHSIVWQDLGMSPQATYYVKEVEDV